MTYSLFDDVYDEHEKVEDAWERHCAVVGLHVMATTHCNRILSDGVIRPAWMELKLRIFSQRERRSVLAAMTASGLFDVLKAGHVLDLTDAGGNALRIGPFREDRYVVHDFLDRHDSSVQVKQRRAAAAAKKRKQRAKKYETDLGCPPGTLGGTPTGTPLGTPQGTPQGSPPHAGPRTHERGGAPAQPLPDQPSPDQVPHPSPPASGGGERRRRGSRADGTSPRQLARRPEQLLSPSDTDRSDFEALQDSARTIVGDEQHGMWIAPLQLAGTDDQGTLVLDAPDGLASWVQDRFGQVLDTAGPRPARLRATASGSTPGSATVSR